MGREEQEIDQLHPGEHADLKGDKRKRIRLHCIDDRFVWWQANLIAAALKEIGVPRAIVLGHSWGTLVAVSLALKYPQEVQALILVITRKLEAMS
jgi:pimeloyl-ACP methyl ester carboxylesterase